MYNKKIFNSTKNKLKLLQETNRNLIIFLTEIIILEPVVYVFDVMVIFLRVVFGCSYVESASLD